MERFLQRCRTEVLDSFSARVLRDCAGKNRVKNRKEEERSGTEHGELGGENRTRSSTERRPFLAVFFFVFSNALPEFSVVIRTCLSCGRGLALIGQCDFGSTARVSGREGGWRR